MADKVQDKIIAVKTRKGRVARIVREHYLRDDIYCQYSQCKRCPTQPNALLVPPEEYSHIIIPDTKVVDDYLELFELPDLKNIVFAQTTVQFIQEKTTTRTYQRLRAITKDIRRSSIVFANENFSQTFVDRAANESLEDRNHRAVMMVADWYTNHLQGKIPVFYLSEDIIWREKAKDIGLNSMSLKDYLDKYHIDNSTVLGLFDSLSLLLAQKEENEGSLDVPTQFEDYMPEDVLDAKIKSGALYQGKIQCRASNPEEAEVRLGEKSALGRDILIPSKILRNRAVHGDIVAVELLDRRLWRAPSQMLRSGVEEGNSSAAPDAGDNLGEARPCGKIVGIIQRNWRPYVCTLQVEENEKDGSGPQQQQKAERILAVPWDWRVPLIRIQTRQFGQLSNQRIVVNIDSWDVNSMHPTGHYVRSLGEIGLAETDVQSLLVENQISYSEFGPNMMSSLPTKSWTPPPDEVKRRRDLRSWRVFSIDPIGSQDIDDALSVTEAPNGNTLIGCHIADVAYFVKEDTLLDYEARSRSTSVYLADRRIDMLPAILSEFLCSIRCNQERFAMSVVWEFEKKTNEVVDTWFGRTIINSKYELNYQEAQNIIDDKAEEKKKFGNEYKALREDLLKLRRIYMKIRDKRLASGALELASSEVRFELDNNRNPTKINTKKELEVMKLVAEYMILANCSVAEFIYKKYPECSLLRRHPLPRLDAFADVIEAAASKGITIDTSTNKALAQSLAKIPQVVKDELISHIIKNLTTTAMAEAEYFSTGSFDITEYYHYGLAADFYTHFTSPIRRYADVVVHRTLLRCLADPKPAAYIPNQQLQELARHINLKHRTAKQCQRDSVDLFEVIFFKKHHVVADAVIFNMKQNGFYVFAPKYGIKGTVYLKDKDGKLIIPDNCLSLNPNEYESSLKVLDFSLNEERNKMGLRTTGGKTFWVELFDHVTVKIYAGESRAHLPPIKFELIHFGEDAELKEKGEHGISKPIDKDDAGYDISGNPGSGETAASKQVTPVKVSTNKKNPEEWTQEEEDIWEYSQSRGEETLFGVLEKLNNVSLNENLATVNGPAKICKSIYKSGMKGRRLFGKREDLYSVEWDDDLSYRKEVGNKFNHQIERMENELKTKAIQLIKSKRYAKQ